MSWNDISDKSMAASRLILEAVAAKDQATAEHCVRVGRGARLLAEAAGLDLYGQKLCEFAGVFHDVGKMHVPDEILTKPAKLTDEEFEIMKEHPLRSVEMIQPLVEGSRFMADLIPGVRHHHERYDGRGYPDGVMGDAIPLESRIILIADTFDAMTATRVYRKGLPAEAAYAELKLHAGRQFDARLVKIFLDAHALWGKREAKVELEFNATVLKVA